MRRLFPLLYALGALAAQDLGAAFKTIYLQRRAEPNERAFTILVPRGWRVQGGIFRIDPSRAGGPANAIGAKCDFTVKRDEAGTVLIHVLPEMLYFDVRRSPAGQMGLYPPGSNYNGMTVYPVMSALDFLRRVAFTQAHRQARAVQILEQRSLPQMAQRYLARVRGLPIQMTFSYDAAALTATYEEGGVRYKERMLTVVEDWGQLGAGMWGNKETLYFRAPVAEFEQWAKVLALIQNSVKFNPQWIAGELRGQIERGQIAISTQQEVQRIEREIVAHRQRTNAEIQNDMFLTLTGQEEFVNPFTKEIERDSDQWRYRWVTPGGDVAVSNDQYYDPNHDLQINRSDFKRTPVRPR
jgi:hypothetical protein